MIVIVPHTDLELKLINAQKKIIRQIFDINNQIIPSHAKCPVLKKVYQKRVNL